MKLRTKDWMPPAAWFVAGIFATGSFWYFLSRENVVGALVSAFGAVTFVGVAIYLHMRLAIVRSRARNVTNNSHHIDELAEFLAEAHRLRARRNERPLPIAEHNKWVTRVEQYLGTNLGRGFKVRFSDFSGMTFWGSGSEKSKFERSLDGRCRRLHEFMKELGA